MKKRMLSALLALCMMLTMAPVAFAADPDGSESNPFTSVSEYNTAVAGNTWDGKDIYLKIAGTANERKTINVGEFNLTNVQSRANPPKLHLTIEYCDFTGNTSGDTQGNTSFMYLSNCQELVIDNCTFNAGDSGLKYGINWNLIQITDATVSITNCTFNGEYGENAIKLNQRNGDDDKAGDVSMEDEFPASIKSATISGCTFDKPDKAIILLGSAGKGESGVAAPSTGAFPVTITADSNGANVFLAYLASEQDATDAASNPSAAVQKGLAVALTEGQTATKAAKGDPIVTGTQPVAQIGNEGGFLTLANALLAAEDGDTVNLLKNVELTDGVNIDKKVALDLNGYTITDNSTEWNGNDYLVAVKRGGDLTINDSSANKTGAITTTNEKIYASVKMTIKGEDANGKDATLTVNGGKLEGYYYGISGNGTRHNTSITINGGEITASNPEDDTVAIYQPQKGTLIINNGCIHANTGIEIRAGELTVNEGAVITGGDGTPTVNENGNGSTTTNSGIAVAQHTTKQPITVNINGGTITGNAAVYESNPQNNNDPDNPVTVNVENATLNGNVNATGFGGITMNNVTITGSVNNEVSGTKSNGSMAILNSTISTGTVPSTATVYNCKNGQGGSINNSTLDAGKVAIYNGKADTLGDALSAANGKGGTVYLVADAKLETAIPANTTLDVAKGVTLSIDNTNLTSLITSQGKIKANAGSKLNVGDTEMIGDSNANINLTKGYIDVSVVDSALKLDFVGAKAEVPENQRWTLAKTVGQNTVPMNVTLDASTTLTVNSTGDDTEDDGFRVANDSTLTNNGKVVVNGVMSISSEGKVDGSGSITVDSNGVLVVNKSDSGDSVGTLDNAVTNNGTFVWNGGENTAPTATITLASGGKVYSNANIADKLSGEETMSNKTYDGTAYSYAWQYDVPSSSSGGGSSSSSYTVSVASGIDNGKVTVSPKSASKGDTVTITVTPDEGYELDTLTVTDKNGDKISVTDKGNGKYTFTMPSGKVTIDAAFAEAAETPDQVGPFEDVSTDDWFADAVQYMLDNGMMNGVTENTFAPNTTTTRGMIVTMLHRLEGEPSAAVSSFTDVAADAYYGDAVAWAAANSIVNGMSDTIFAPNNAITREQMAAILYRYAQYKGYDTSVGGMSLAEYTDADQISSYATTAMQWANENGLITGRTDTTLVPQGTATRAEVATILMRFCENIAK